MQHFVIAGLGRGALRLSTAILLALAHFNTLPQKHNRIWLLEFYQRVEPLRTRQGYARGSARKWRVAAKSAMKMVTAVLDALVNSMKIIPRNTIYTTYI
jgi:hypothetical protein